MKVPVDATFETVGYALAGVAGLLALVALVLAVMLMRNASAGQRKSIAIFVIVGSMLAALLAVLLVVVGPKIRTEAPLPFSTGLFVFFGGITAALASSVFAMRAPASTTSRIPRQQVGRQSRPSMPPVPMSPAGGLDMQALLSDDAGLRPTGGMPPARGSPVHSPGGALPGPSGPLGAVGNQTGPHQPLFSSAPQLRPLYDVAPGQGGTGGFVPSQPQTFALRPPTPIPRDQISALAGIPTPASIEAQRPPTEATDRDLLGTARGVGKPKTLPPPNRSRPVSVAPIPPIAQPMPPPPPKGPSTLATAAVPPPPNTTLASPGLQRLESEGEEFDAMKTYQREEPKPPPPPKKPALPKPVVPMPAKRAAVPAPLPAPPPQKTRLITNTEDASLDTDVSTQAIGDTQAPTESFDTATNESTNFAQRPRPPTSTTQTTPADDDSVDDELMTAAREKVEQSTDMELPTVRPPTETAQSTARPPTETAQSTVRPPTETSPSTEAAPEPEPVPAPPAPAPRAPTPTPARAATPTPAAPPAPPAPEPEPPKHAESKLPVSTAPESLPPPTEKQAATSGPSPACPQCEAPMAWVEAHLRFYCKSCKMYF